MGPNLSSVNERLLEFDGLIRDGRTAPWSGDLKVGVDLGTANIVLAVVDTDNRPVAGITQCSHVVRDGIVVDYVGAVSSVSRMKAELERRLGQPLRRAAVAVPPGISPGNVRCITNVAEGAGFEVAAVVDEPTAAAKALGVETGVLVDVGGGTTGISILKDGEVLFAADEPTGGTHMTLVLAGYRKCSVEEAEQLKVDAACEDEVFQIVRPVAEKMASIVSGYLRGYDVADLHIVGGACCFRQFEEVFEKNTGIPTVKSAVPLLVTPLGIAMCG